MFDVLVQIYESYGYTAREAATSIVEHNIWGLDIDDRAAQLAYFSVMMKARQYDRRFLSRKDENDKPKVPQPHVYAIRESNDLDKHCIEYFVDSRKELKSAMDILVKELHDAKEYGSILNITQVDFDALYARFEEIRHEDVPGIYSYQAIDTLLPFVQVAQTMAQKYHNVTTNPPYMGAANMAAKLSDFTKKNYPDSKADLYAAFVERCASFTDKNGYYAMITQHSWMFLTAFERVRNKILEDSIVTLGHLGLGVFVDLNSKVVQSVTFVVRKGKVPHYRGNYDRLFEKEGVCEDNEDKEKWLLSGKHRFRTSQDEFERIPGAPVAYWISEAAFEAFSGTKTSDYSVSKCGMGTSDNNRFLRLWFEVNFSNIGFGYRSIEETTNCKYRWFPYNKGGDFRKWYGNRYYLVNFYNNAEDIREATKNATGGRVVGTDYYFKKQITWSDITFNVNFRYFEEGFIFDASANAAFVEQQDLFPMLGYLNTKVVNEWANILNPTMHFKIGNFQMLPYRRIQSERVTALVKENIEMSKVDWDSFELSWDFSKHPLIRGYNTIREAYEEWEKESTRRFDRMKSNEEELNAIYISFFNLADEFTPTINAADITISKADKTREVKSFISYAVGCMFGRYSLDAPGLAYAGGNWDSSKYSSFVPDRDGIIPICDDEYFEDDIVGRFVAFVQIVYGVETLEENLGFIADALGGKGSSREVIRSYFINDFYSDHCDMYSVTGSGKRPIYWLLDSGKKNGFKCLIYMHRYQPDTIARIRTDYVHEQQSRYRTAIADLESRIANAGTGERVKLSKQLTKLQEQAEELRVYEEKIHHLADQMIRIDLDDGVKHNYSIFQDVLAKIK